MRKLSLFCAICIVIYLVIVAVTSVTLRHRIHLAGDLASDVVLAASDNGIQVSENATRAGVQIVLLTDWEKIAFVPGAAELCGAACFESANELVQINHVGLIGYRRTIFLNISRFLDSNAKGIFAFDDNGLDCLVQNIQSEILESKARARGPDCAQIYPTGRLWRIGNN